MWPYLALFAGVAWMALIRTRVLAWDGHGGVTRHLPSVGVFIVLVLMIGLRHEVGGDWGSYEAYVADQVGVPFTQFGQQGTDIAYSLLNWLGANWGGDVYLVNVLCAVFFGWGLLSFCRIQPRPWLALLVAVPYLVTVVAMGYSRQGVAIGFAMLGLVALHHQRMWAFFAWVTVAALFHKTAVLLIPLALFSGGKRRLIKVLGVAVIAPLAYGLLLQDSVENLTKNYIEAEYSSAGAWIRVLMNALPAALYLIYRRHFHLPAHQHQFWTWMAMGALVSIGLLIVFRESTTAVDRMALYWNPIQIFVWSRLPDALGVRGRRNLLWLILIVAYSAAVLLTWLIYAVHAEHWLPYQFYPFEVLFGSV